MRKRLLIVISALLLAAVLCACNSVAPSVMEEKGVSMELPVRMTNATGQLGYQGYDIAYVGDNMAIFGSRGDLKAEGVAEGMTLQQAAENAMTSLEAETELITAQKGYLYFVYEADTGINEFVNVTAFFENGTELWMIQISSKQKTYDEAKVLAVLDSVTFAQ